MTEAWRRRKGKKDREGERKPEETRVHSRSIPGNGIVYRV